MSGTGKDHTSDSKKSKQEENNRNHFIKEAMPGSELWTNGLICAFEYVQVQRKPIMPRSYSKIHCANKIDGENMKKQVPTSRVTEAFSPKASGNNLMESASLTELGSHRISSLDDDIERKPSQSDHLHTMERLAGSRWVPIGWARISELVQTVHVDADWASQQFDIMDEENNLTTADLAAPYWERPGGPRWWCHVAPDHPFIDAWLRNAQWLHPAISIALRDESRLISDRMKYLLYEVPVRVAGGLLFELVGQSAGDPYIDEDDTPVVLRSWQANNFLITALHVKGSVSSINVLGITEVQEQLLAGGNNSPRSVHEVIAHLATRLARWDDRLFRKSIFGAADEVELMFMNRRHQEDLKIFSIILNQEIRKLLRQVIRVKWTLHAREEIVFELLQHLRGEVSKSLLERLRKDTREMLEEQEAVRGRLFTIQGVMKETVRAWLQDRSLRVTHNLAVFGGCGLVLSVITGLFGINVDGIPGADNTPYAFGLFAAILVALGVVLISVGLFCLGLKKPITEQQIISKKLELQELVNMFQHEAETHAQVRKNFSRQNLPPTSADIYGDDASNLLFN